MAFMDFVSPRDGQEVKMSEALADSLSPAEQAFFDSKGETAIPVEGDGGAAANPGGADPVAEQVPGTDQTEGAQLRDEKGKFVPHGAFHEERTKRQNLERQLAEMQTKQAVLEDRWNTILKVGDKKDEPAAPPNPEEDIFGYVKWQADQLKQIQSEKQARDEADRQHQTMTKQEEAIWSTWQQSRNEYAQTNKEFDQAATWLSDFRMNQLKALSVIDPRMGNDGARNQQINEELKAIVVAAQQQGRSPAELVHQLAVSYGFKPTAATDTTDPSKSLAAQVDNLGKALEASRTLTASGGKSGADPMSAESIANMSEGEFSAWIKDPANERRFRQIMGG
jgi:hypothetical protein